MAHWSTGYADFHEEIWAPPPEPLRPLRLPCPECGDTFPDLTELREHLFATHPVVRPMLGYRGRVCGDTRLLVQRQTTSEQWSLSHCTAARIDGAQVEPDELGARLSTARGVVVVEISNERANRVHEFDFSIPSEDDLRGVDAVLEDLLGSGTITSTSISAFYERAEVYGTARNYAGGIAEYLYWLSGRRAGVDRQTAARHREKLNRAAHLLRRFDRKNVLVVDWGGGTLDLTLCRLIDGRVVQLQNAGTGELGGDVFDDEIAGVSCGTSANS